MNQNYVYDFNIIFICKNFCFWIFVFKWIISTVLTILLSPLPLPPPQKGKEGKRERGKFHSSSGQTRNFMPRSELPRWDRALTRSLLISSGIHRASRILRQQAEPSRAKAGFHWKGKSLEIRFPSRRGRKGKETIAEGDKLNLQLRAK